MKVLDGTESSTGDSMSTAGDFGAINSSSGDGKGVVAGGTVQGE